MRRTSVTPMTRGTWVFNLIFGAAAALSLYTIYLVFMSTPTAQFAAGGLAQKIFYFHVPSILCGMFPAGIVCGFASGAYLLKPTESRNALAQAGAECAVAFSAVMLTTGPIWAKRAWGVYWTWDPQLTTALLTALIYFAVMLLRLFGGDGGPERKFAAALGTLGTVNLPIIHYSVKKFRGNHPVVMRSGGGGLADDMHHAYNMGLLAMLCFAIVLIWLRRDANLVASRLKRAEEAVQLHGEPVAD
jgi:heme exporter protein C